MKGRRNINCSRHEKEIEINEFKLAFQVVMCLLFSFQMEMMNSDQMDSRQWRACLIKEYGNRGNNWNLQLS